MMPSEVLIALCSLAGTLLGSLFGVLQANRLTGYRIEQLEKKMDKHNGVIERMALNEQEDATQWKRIDEHKDLLDDHDRRIRDVEGNR